MRLLTLADAPDDGEDLRRRKRTQVAMTLASLPMIGGILVAEAAVHGARLVAPPCLAYIVGSAAMLAWLARTKRYDVFRWLHPLFVFAMPWTLQEVAGGFVATGGVGLWGICGVASVPMFVASRHTLPAFAAYLAVAAGTVLLDGLRAAPAPRAEVAWLFAANTLGVTAFLMVSVRSFVGLLSEERRRSERLLLNVLPAPIARRLKADGGTIADRHDEATVLFADLVGFTTLSARLEPEALVELLDAVFRAFDTEVDALGLEKIKTIGDAYMAVGGVPRPRPDHAEAVATLALRMREALRATCAARGVDLGMRIGLHSGPVVAGVIGTRKFAFDLWGDTVNTASRMESHGEAGRIHLTEEVAGRLGARFRVVERGTVAVKGKGDLRTFWLEGERSGAESGS